MSTSIILVDGDSRRATISASNISSSLIWIAGRLALGLADGLTGVLPGVGVIGA